MSTIAIRNGFRWINDVDNFDVMNVTLDSLMGYNLEIDSEYPYHIHNAHSDLSFCPMRENLLGKREEKLLATLYDKKYYVIHYHNLQQCIRSHYKDISYTAIRAIYMASRTSKSI